MTFTKDNLRLIIQAGVSLCVEPKQCCICKHEDRVCYWGLMDLWNLRRTSKTIFSLIGDERNHLPMMQRIGDVLKRNRCTQTLVESLLNVLSEIPNTIISGSFVLEHVVYGTVWMKKSVNDNDCTKDMDVFFGCNNSMSEVIRSLKNIKELDILRTILNIDIMEEYTDEMDNFVSLHRYMNISDIMKLDVIFIEHIDPYDIRQYIVKNFDLDVCKVGICTTNGKFWAEHPNQVVTKTSVMKYLPILYNGSMTQLLDGINYVHRLEKYQNRGFEIRLQMQKRLISFDNDTNRRGPCTVEKYIGNRLLTSVHLNTGNSLDVEIAKVRLVFLIKHGLIRGHLVGDCNKIPNVTLMMEMLRKLDNDLH